MGELYSNRHRLYSQNPPRALTDGRSGVHYIDFIFRRTRVKRVCVRTRVFVALSVCVCVCGAPDTSRAHLHYGTCVQFILLPFDSTFHQILHNY